MKNGFNKYFADAMKESESRAKIDMMDTIVNTLKKLKEKSVSDSDLGVAIGVSSRTIARWREGDSVPHPALHKSILDVLQKKWIDIS